MEGSELDALRGALHILARDRPAIAMEVHPGSLQGDMNELSELLAGFGYPVKPEFFRGRTAPFDVYINAAGSTASASHAEYLGPPRPILGLSPR